MPTREIVDVIFSIFRTNPLKVVSRQKALFGVILLMGLSLLLYQSLLAQQLTKSKPIQRYFSAQKRLLVYKERVIKEPQLLLNKIEQMKRKLENLDGRFTPEQKLAQLFDEIKNLVSKTENQIVSLDIRRPVSLGNYQKLPFSISVEGYYVDVILLLNKLEEYPRLINIKDIKIKRSGGGYPKVSMNLDAEVFVVKD